MPIPADFRELLDMGCGGHIAIRRPNDPVADRDLLDVQEQSEDLNYFWERGNPPPVVPMPESAVLIAWASGGGGEELFWWVDVDDDSADYPTVIGTEDRHTWERFDMGVAKFSCETWRWKSRFGDAFTGFA